jgi:TetR/AcrR family transcriptional regulator
LEQDSRTKLIAAATHLFADKGFSAVSIRELAQQAGVNSALISYHFDGKEGLYTAVLENQFSLLLQLAERINKEPLTPEQRIREYAITVLNIHQKYPALIRLLYSELFNPSPCFEVITQKFLAKLFKILFKAINDGIEAGQFRADLNIENAVISLAGIMNFYFISRPLTKKLLPETENCAATYIKQAVEIFLAGITRRTLCG